MKNNINLSYILTTYNKINYLKEVLPYLLDNCQEDEEIVVVDGGSNDETPQYIENLYKQGKIHQFISEKDSGEAEGFNKAILMAKGELVKVITDDDLYDYQNIQICKQFMLKNKEIDVIIGNIASVYLTENKDKLSIILMQQYQKWFEEWINKETKNCFFCGLSLLIRKKSFSFLGLLDSSFKYTDLEFSIRITTKQANIAFYKPLLVCSVVNQNSSSVNSRDVFEFERNKVVGFYDYKIPISLIQKNQKTPSIFQRIWNKILRTIGIKKPEILIPNLNPTYAEFNHFEKISDLYPYLHHFLEKYNQENTIEKDDLFILRK
ncbi:MAG: glycosyltransferase [Bacteroidetes bacterium]|nr:MAG: glycosyltransferase [Bacteroidota bacterium]TAG90493.1 MAG: glycosyltransferase [Bacteroidota bacterium]